MASALEDPRIIEFDVRTDEMLVNMGPQHPSTHGVLRLVLRTDGEIVSEVTPHIGYLHRCAEKIGENLSPRQWIPYTDRMDYLAAMNMNLGWSLTVEKLMGLEIPEKAKHLRVIIAELNRIASHLVGMGAYGLDLGTSAHSCMPSARERKSSICSKKPAVRGSPTVISRSAAPRTICLPAG
jgi:NADH-quinone oxidoreductase subunit D